MTAAMAAVATPRAATSEPVAARDRRDPSQHARSREKRQAIEVHRGRGTGSRSRPADEQHPCYVTPDATGQEARREHSREVRLLGLGHRHRDTGREEERSPPHRPDREGNAEHQDGRCEELPAAVIESPAELPEIELRQDKSEEPSDSRARAPRSSEPLCGGDPPAAMIFVYPYSDDAIGAASRHPRSNGRPTSPASLPRASTCSARDGAVAIHRGWTSHGPGRSAAHGPRARPRLWRRSDHAARP